MDTVHQALGAKNAHARGLIGPGENARQIANPRTSATRQDDETLGNPAVSSGSTLSKQKFRRSSGHRFVKVEGLVLHSRSCRTETLGRLRPQFYFASGDTNVFTGTSETGAKIHRA